MDCTIHVAKTKALISFAVTAKLICVFVFAYAKSLFSCDAAHFVFAVTFFRFCIDVSICTWPMLTAYGLLKYCLKYE